MKAMNLTAGEDAVSIGRDPLKLICNGLSAFKDAPVTPAEAAPMWGVMIAQGKPACRSIPATCARPPWSGITQEER
jgi:hypothetical protein